MRLEGLDRIHELGGHGFRANRSGIAECGAVPVPAPWTRSALAGEPPPGLGTTLRERARDLVLDDGGPAFREILRQAYPDADRFDLQRLELAALRGELPLPERVRLVARDELEGANAAYDHRHGGEVLLARDLASDPGLLLRAYAEEVGHHLDRWLGGRDSPGDEGAIFARGLLGGAALDAAALAAERADRDRGSLAINGEAVRVEFYDSDYAGGGFHGDNPNDGGDSPNDGVGDGVSGSRAARDPDRGSDAGSAGGGLGYNPSGGISSDPGVARLQYRAEAAAEAAEAEEALAGGTLSGLPEGSFAMTGGLEAEPDAVGPLGLAAGEPNGLEGIGPADIHDGGMSDPGRFALDLGTDFASESRDRTFTAAGLDTRSLWGRLRDWAAGLFSPTAPELTPDERARLYGKVVAPGLAGLATAEAGDPRLGEFGGVLAGQLLDEAGRLARAGLARAEIDAIIGETARRAAAAVAADPDAYMGAGARTTLVGNEIDPLDPAGPDVEPAAPAAPGEVHAAKLAQETRKQMLGAIVDAAERSPTSAVAGLNLEKALASEAQLSWRGIPTHGFGTTHPLREAGRLATEFGGDPEDWSKMSSWSYTARGGATIETHWFENVVTGVRVQEKSIAFPGETRKSGVDYQK